MKKLIRVMGFVLLVSALFLSPFTSPARAQPFQYIIDQSQTTALFSGAGGFSSITYMGPIGQEFVPTLDALDFVELATADGDIDNGQGAQLQLLIHADTIQGEILGSSAIASVPDNFEDITRFEFSTPVQLVPGNRYVIEIVLVSGDNWTVYSNHVYPDAYPAGRIIYYGIPYENENPGVPMPDFWFTEGVRRYLPQTVSVDVKPGNPENTVPCNNPNALIAVGILSDANFDASLIDLKSLTVDGGGERHTDRLGNPVRHVEDLNQDGRPDLLVHVSLASTTLTCSSTVVTVNGVTTDGLAFTGQDTIRMVPKKGKGG